MKIFIAIAALSIFCSWAAVHATPAETEDLFPASTTEKVALDNSSLWSLE